jgi:hypothetical protein
VCFKNGEIIVSPPLLPISFRVLFFVAVVPMCCRCAFRCVCVCACGGVSSRFFFLPFFFLLISLSLCVGCCPADVCLRLRYTTTARVPSVRNRRRWRLLQLKLCVCPFLCSFFCRLLLPCKTPLVAIPTYFTLSIVVVGGERERRTAGERVLDSQTPAPRRAAVPSEPFVSSFSLVATLRQPFPPFAFFCVFSPLLWVVIVCA